VDKPAQWALVGAAWFLAVSVAVFGFLAWQRLGAVRPQAGPPAASVAGPAAAAGSASPWALQPDGTALCPVTGQRVQVGPDTPTVTYLGNTYYFSGDKDASGQDARTRFLMDPDSWLHRGAAP
jgi:hypothetical protein